ncbi:DUF4352 domain-containing protein [Micromonospora sp. CPCC 205539]|uniref:DUF4352 domain-containing protein n=1 Tax=Micromonospora sp. CPCC 205539 TaxID=3122408 RepID=UPI002FF06D31
MTHPQPPVGPQDPQQPNPEPPTQPFATTPQPSYASAPPPPFASTPYPTSPDQPWPQPPFAGGAYPPPGGGAYPPPGGGAYPLTMPPPTPAKSSKKTVVVVAVTAAVLALLCCAGGIVAVVIGANRAAEQVTDARPTPNVTRGVGLAPGTAPATARPSTNAETRNMAPGETLVVDGDEGSFEITVTKFSTSSKACTTYGLKPDEGMYVIADVKVSITKGTASVNPLFFQWVAPDGTETNAIGGAFSGCGKPMPSGNDLTAGSTRTGSVVFDVHDTKGVLEYQYRFETVGSWKP